MSRPGKDAMPKKCLQTPSTGSPARAVKLPAVTEKQFQRQVKQLAKMKYQKNF